MEIRLGLRPFQIFETLYSCQVMDDREHYEGTREQIKRSVQAEYDKEIEGNVL